MKKVIFLIIFIFVNILSIKAQYYVAVKGDSTFMEIDSVVLTVENTYENIIWQVSTDSLSWTELDEGDKLSLWIDSIASYRAVAKSGNCPVISDTIVAGLKKIEVENNFSMDNQGIVYEIPSGLKIIVPTDAIEGVNTVSVEELDSLQAISFLPFPADSGKTFIYALKFNSTDTALLKPVKVRIPTSKYNRGDLPRIFLFNPETEEWTNYTEGIICNRQSGYIELTLNKLQPFRIDVCPAGLLITKEKSAQLKNSVEQNLMVNSDDPCYDKVFIKSKYIDFNTIRKDQECYFIEEEGIVEFLTCPDRPNEYNYIREIGKDCPPEFEVSIDDDLQKEFIKVGDTLILSVFTYIDAGGKRNPLRDQYILFTLPDGLTSEINYGRTNEQGKIDFVLSATNKNLDALINLEVRFSYCLEIIEAKSTGNFELNCLQSLKELDVPLDKRVFIYDDCTGSDEIDCSLSNNTAACQTIKDGLLGIQSLMIIPSYRVLDFNETYRVPAYIDFKPFSSYPLASQINWSSSDEGIATVDEQGMVTAHSTEGTAIITANLCDLEITDTIEVRNIICKNAGYLVDKRDSNEYRLVEIGSKIWMAENLDYYTSTGSRPNSYGRLYTWTTALTVCPSGWHLPSQIEWVQLVNALGMNPKCFWPLPGGYYDIWMGYSGGISCWWSSTESPYVSSDQFPIPGLYHAYGWRWSNSENNFDWIGFYKVHLLSVRCVRD